MTCIKCEKPVYCSNFCKNHFENYLENKVRKTIRKYKLCGKKDKVGVAVSGGKDSTILLYILKKLGYDVEAITINANIGNYSKESFNNLTEFCKKYEVTLHNIEFRKEYGHSLCYIRDVLKEKGHNYQSCMICGVLKRNLLNKYSKKLGFDYLATGHNLDDEAHSFLMNIFRNDTNRVYRGGPISGIEKNKNFVTRIKPLYQVSEKESESYSKVKGFKVKYTKCPCSVDAFRREFREMVGPYSEKHPDAIYNIMKFYMSEFYTKKDQFKGATVNICENCGEPTSKKVCKNCEIIENFKK